VYKRKVEGTRPEADFAIAGRHVMRSLAVNPRKQTVMMKPNVTAGCPRDSGIVTHPAFVGGMVDYLVDDLGLSAERIFIGEATSPSTTPEQRDLGWARSGYTEIAREKRVSLIDLADYGNIRITPGQTVQLHNIGISRWAASPEVFYINVPKLKTHNLSVVTLCGKNQQGIMIPVVDRHLCSEAWRATYGRDFKKHGRDWMRVEDHEAWQRTIGHMHWDVYLACQPDFNIIEGIVGRDGNAFYLGRNFPCGLAIAGDHMPSVDMIASYVMGYTVETLVYLQVGVERGICPAHPDDVDIYLIREDGDREKITDLTRYYSETPFEVYRDIPADYSKKGLFEEYDPNKDSLKATA
jgi:uncharacterized protein (DUF362 family)